MLDESRVLYFDRVTQRCSKEEAAGTYLYLKFTLI
jgi:hypothetical protein